MKLHLNLHNLRKYDLPLRHRSSRAETARLAVCLWGLYGVSVGSTAGWAHPCRFTLRDLTLGQQLPAANFIMHPGRGLNNSTEPRVKDLLNQKLWVFKEHRAQTRTLLRLNLCVSWRLISHDVELKVDDVVNWSLMPTKVHSQ